MRAIYAGSFSPPTLGHLDIIRRGAAMFDELIVAVMSQQAKQYLFTPEARADMLKEITREINNVKIVQDNGLLVDLAHRENADVILRGLRGAEDLAFEMQLAEVNRKIGNIETLFMSCSPQYGMISSTIVRDCAFHGAPIAGMVPDEIVDRVYAVYRTDSNMERKDTYGSE